MNRIHPYQTLCVRRPLRELALGCAVLASGFAACRADSSRRDGQQRSATPDTAVVFLAASLTKPLQFALDSFAHATGIALLRESGASLEHARKITELGRVPDVIALADVEVFPQLLMPAHIRWYAEFARNRMVLGYTDRSRYQQSLDTTTWLDVLARRDVQVGRPDPDLAPAGYRAILVLELAERYYHRPGLAARLLANAPRRNMRPNAAELAALLQTGEVDYVFDYESVANAYGFHFLRLPSAIDLGDPSRAADYASASVRVRGGGAAADSVTFTGRPIVYALSIPVTAPHPRAAQQLAAFLLSGDGRRMLRAAKVDALDRATFVGDAIPDSLRAAAER